MRNLVLGLALLSVPVQAVAGNGLVEASDCLDAPYEEAATPAQVKLRKMVLGLKPALQGFPALLSVLGADDTRLCISDKLIAEKAYVDAETGRIVLSADMSLDLGRIILVHELRHAEQLARGVCPSQSLAMKEYARSVLALEADANAVAALVAWKQKEDGIGALWQAFESWPMTADIAERFAAVMGNSGDVGAAASAAFDQWYASEERTESYYVASCSGYLDRQDQTHALPGYLRLADDYLAGLCILPDGQGYDCAEPARPLR